VTLRPEDVRVDNCGINFTNGLRNPLEGERVGFYDGRDCDSITEVNVEDMGIYAPNTYAQLKVSALIAAASVTPSDAVSHVKSSPSGLLCACVGLERRGGLAPFGREPW
jgi:hypothetical protein